MRENGNTWRKSQIKIKGDIVKKGKIYHDKGHFLQKGQKTGT